MRILVVTNLYPNPYQPFRAAFNRQQFAALAEHHDVRVIAPIAWTDELRAVARVGQRLGDDRRLRRDGLEVLHPAYLYPPKVMRERYGHFYRESIREAFHASVASFRPDVALACWAYPDGWATASLCREVGLPYFVKVHGSDILTLPKIAGRLTGTTDALRSAHGVVAVSRDLARAVVEMGVRPDRVRVVYDGIDRALFRPGDRRAARQRLGLDPDARRLLFVGNLLPVKGLDVLLRACTGLAVAGCEVQCDIIGEGPLRQALERVIATDGLEHRVRLRGPRPHAELPDWYRAADALVLPSRSEGVPNVLLEAAACATPFVASRVGGIPEIAHLGPNTLVPPENAMALAMALRAALDGTLAGSGTAPTQRSVASAAAELADWLDERAGAPASIAA